MTDASSQRHSKLQYNRGLEYTRRKMVRQFEVTPVDTEVLIAEKEKAKALWQELEGNGLTLARKRAAFVQQFEHTGGLSFASAMRETEEQTADEHFNINSMLPEAVILSKECGDKVSTANIMQKAIENGWTTVDETRGVTLYYWPGFEKSRTAHTLVKRQKTVLESSKHPVRELAGSPSVGTPSSMPATPPSKTVPPSPAWTATPTTPQRAALAVALAEAAGGVLGGTATAPKKHDKIPTPAVLAESAPAALGEAAGIDDTTPGAVAATAATQGTGDVEVLAAAGAGVEGEGIQEVPPMGASKMENVQQQCKRVQGLLESCPAMSGFMFVFDHMHAVLHDTSDTSNVEATLEKLLAVHALAEELQVLPR